MIQKEKRVKQDFDVFVFLDNLVEKTKKIMNGVYSDPNNSDKEINYFGKRDSWIRTEIGINLFQVSENLSAGNSIKVITGKDYEQRRSYQVAALSYLNKLRDSIKLGAFFISRISKATLIDWTESKIALEKATRGWIDSDYKRYKHLLQ